MFKEEDPLLSRPSILPLEGGNMCPMGAPGRADRGLHLRADTTAEERGLGFHLPPYSSTYSPPYAAQSYHDEYCSKPDAAVEDASGSERHPSFESLELGFTELLPPLYPRAAQPPSPSPSPWLDSPYLSSSPSPSHSSSLSPFPASSPVSSSPLPPIPTPPYPQYSVYPPEACPSPPANPLPYQDLYQAQYSHYEGWDPRGRALGAGQGAERDAVASSKIQESPLEFSSSASMHHITLEEGETLV